MMIRVNRLQWNTGEIEDFPLYLNPLHIKWMTRVDAESRPVMDFDDPTTAVTEPMDAHYTGISSTGSRRGNRLTHRMYPAHTDLSIGGNNFNVLETPEQILGMLQGVASDTQ